jgi:hypothetical protein
MDVERQRPWFSGTNEFELLFDEALVLLEPTRMEFDAANTDDF